MLRLGILLFAISSPTASARAQPLPAGLNTLCGHIDNGALNPSGSVNRYVYQDKIYAAAGVTADDTPASRRQKVQRLWAQHDLYKRLTCSDPGFHGPLLKWAVHQRFDALVVDYAHKWGLPLNQIDEIDGRTALDYVADERQAAQGRDAPATVRTLGTYFTIMRAAGAKHRVEIDGVDCRTGGFRDLTKCRWAR